MSTLKNLISLVVFLQIAGTPALAYSDSLKPDAEFLTRCGMAPFESVKDILSNPKKVDFNLVTWREEENKIIRSETDVHAIYPHPVSYFVDEMLDYENTKNVFPRAVESLLEYAADDPFGLHSLWMHIDVKVLGFGAEYTYVTDNWMELCNAGYLQKYNLNRSPDGTLYQVLGSWYLEEIQYNGKPHTYIRNFAVIGVRKGSLAMELAMRAFGVWQLRRNFDNINDAIEKRIKRD
jgi:hypothetical protein